MSRTAAELITESVRFAALPETFRRALKMVQAPHYSAADIGNIINQDPALSAQLLKIINSPFYGFPSNINSISRAITILGCRELCNILCANVTIQAFDTFSNDTYIDLERFWRHSLYSAVVAREFAIQLHEQDPEYFFLIGLLHEVGSLVLDQHAPQLAQQAIDNAHRTQSSLSQAERSLIGTDHAEVGAYLLQQWQLPNKITEAIAFHHNPLQARQFPREAWIAYAANIITNQTTHIHISDPASPTLESLTSGEMRLIDQQQLNRIIEQTERKFHLACQAFLKQKVSQSKKPLQPA